MQTMNQSLATLYQKRLITLESALGASSMKDELEQMISRGAGVVPNAGIGRGCRRGRGQDKSASSFGFQLPLRNRSSTRSWEPVLRRKSW